MKNLKEKINLKEGATLYFNKPLEWTSFNLVNKFRYLACRYLGVKKLKVGHAGTLDPLATGVMILCTGKHTKKIEELQKGSKTYVAELHLGATTPTLDRETEETEAFPFEHINIELIQETLPQFIGKIQQVPPIFSAVKVNGKRAYKLARAGKEEAEIELKAKEIEIYDIEILDFSLPKLRLKISCGKGTYIRSLARDLGEALGSGAYLTALERTQVGEAELDNCIEVEDIPQFLSQMVITEKEID